DFKVDGTTKSTDTASPWTYAWNSASIANGTHTLSAVTTDTAGNTSTSTASVTVQNGVGASIPGAPTLGSATAGNGSVALSWSAPASEGGPAITAKKVSRETPSGNEPLLTPLGNVTSYNDTTSPNGTTYYYKVSAVNAIGESTLSNELSAAPATIPGAPTMSS